MTHNAPADNAADTINLDSNGFYHFRCPDHPATEFVRSNSWLKTESRRSAHVAMMHGRRS